MPHITYGTNFFLLFVFLISMLHQNTVLLVWLCTSYPHVSLMVDSSLVSTHLSPVVFFPITLSFPED